MMKILLPRLGLMKRAVGGSTGAFGGGISIFSPLLSEPNNNNNNNNNNSHNHHQIRLRWTKAKIKRFARFERRQKMEKLGQALPKPPYYFPIDTPVANAKTAEERLAELAQTDAEASATLQARVAAAEPADKMPTLRFHMTTGPLLTMSDRVRKLLDLHSGSQRQVVQAQKQRGMQLFAKRPGDTGSSDVQVVALTTRIQQLQMHMAQHRKDKHSKRGLDALYVRRRKMLDYMERRDFEAYRRVVKTLGLVR
jgi:small subunit ribosomal protein S15